MNNIKACVSIMSWVIATFLWSIKIVCHHGTAISCHKPNVLFSVDTLDMSLISR